MSDAPYSLRGRAGDTFTRYLYHRESDGITAINLAGASVEWSLRSGATAYQFIDTTQASITDEAQGEIKLYLTPTETRELAGRSWDYEVTLEFADADGTRLTILDGYIAFSREIVGVLEVPA